MQQPLQIREGVEEVSPDMWGGFSRVIAKVFPNAILVYDRFHVMQMVNRRLNHLRRQFKVTVKGSRNLLLKNYQDLSELQKLELTEILQKHPSLGIAYQMKEEFREIYEKTTRPKAALRKFRKWGKYAELFYSDVVETINKHLEGICNYFISRTTNGVMSGVNNKNREIIRRSFGLKNFDNLRSRLLAGAEYKQNLSP